MKIDVCYDLEDVQPSRLQLQRGEKLQLEVWFHGPNWDKVYDPGLAIKFGAKEAGKYASSEPIMVYCDTFTLDESGCYKGVLQLNTTNLLNLIGEEKSVTLDAQFEFSGKDTVYKTKLLKLVVSNDVIKGDEGVPVPAPSYVTKDELGQEVKSQVDVIMSDKMDEMTSLASDAAASAEAAEQSKNNAATSATNAANSESLSQKWAINPRDVPVTGSGVTAKYSALHWATYGQQYAQTASDAATSAASSRDDCELFSQSAYNQAVASAKSAAVSTEQAKIAADLVAGVAGVGDQVTAAQNAAATAASKATEAANSATAADSSKKAAATSASNAKTSETNAANSAKSAADSKTACEGILAQMQGLLKNVPLLDGDNIFTGINQFPGINIKNSDNGSVYGLGFLGTTGSFGLILAPYQDFQNLGQSPLYYGANGRWNIYGGGGINLGGNLTVTHQATFKNGIINESGIYYTKTGTPVQIGAVTTAADGVYHGWLVMNNGEVNGAQLSAKAMTTTGVSPDPVLAFTDRTAVLYEGGLDMRSHKILNVASGTAPTDAATVAQAGSGGSVPENVITTDNVAQHAVTSFNGNKGDVTYNYTLPSSVLTTSNIASYAVTSFGGKNGAIGVGSNLSMSGNTLNASGGGGGVTSVNGLTGAIELRLGNMPHPEDGSVSALYIFANDEYGNEGVASDRYMMGLKGASYGPYTQCFDFTGI